MWTGDDPLHNSNNNLIIERDDGRMVWAPYSIDISAGAAADWGYHDTPLTGSNSLARGCQSDPQCWADTITTCEDLIARFDALNPENLVDEAVDTLTNLDMMRSGDEGRAADLREWYVERQEGLTEELERYRNLPDVNGNCPEGLQLCNSETCGTEEQCELWLCPGSQPYCESLQRCIDSRYEECPSCDEATPYYCEYSGECMASSDDCGGGCPYPYVFCPMYGGCVPREYCGFFPPPDDDAGVDMMPPDGAGAGAAGMVAPPVAGMR
jgi:hypothetical protein